MLFYLCCCSVHFCNVPVITLNKSHNIYCYSLKKKLLLTMRVDPSKQTFLKIVCMGVCVCIFMWNCVFAGFLLWLKKIKTEVPWMKNSLFPQLLVWTHTRTHSYVQTPTRTLRMDCAKIKLYLTNTNICMHHIIRIIITDYYLYIIITNIKIFLHGDTPLFLCIPNPLPL